MGSGVSLSTSEMTNDERIMQNKRIEFAPLNEDGSVQHRDSYHPLRNNYYYQKSFDKNSSKSPSKDSPSKKYGNNAPIPLSLSRAVIESSIISSHHDTGNDNKSDFDMEKTILRAQAASHWHRLLLHAKTQKTHGDDDIITSSSSSSSSNRNSNRSGLTKFECKKCLSESPLWSSPQCLTCGYSNAVVQTANEKKKENIKKKQAIDTDDTAADAQEEDFNDMDILGNDEEYDNLQDLRARNILLKHSSVKKEKEKEQMRQKLQEKASESLPSRTSLSLPSVLLQILKGYESKKEGDVSFTNINDNGEEESEEEYMATVSNSSSKGSSSTSGGNAAATATATATAAIKRKPNSLKASKASATTTTTSPVPSIDILDQSSASEASGLSPPSVTLISRTASTLTVTWDTENDIRLALQRLKTIDNRLARARYQVLFRPRYTAAVDDIVGSDSPDNGTGHSHRNSHRNSGEPAREQRQWQWR
jgi:hypothetical protein